MKEILILAGDGIGTEVTIEAEKILRWFSENFHEKFTISHALIGGAAYDETGSPLPVETITKAKAVDAVLLGAVGGYKWESLDISVRPEKGLLGIRKELGLFANLRPAICFDALSNASTLKNEVVAGLDIMIIRELTGGIYFGEPRGVEVENGEKIGRNTLIYSESEIRRIAELAFDLAGKRGGKVCSIDKANVLECTELWRETVQKLRDSDYQNIELSHIYVDNAAMQLVRNPKQFDVIVTGNLFGDIISDCAAMLTGSLGMLPSASLGIREENGKIPALYEPVHGSAPDIAGQNKANPLATILSISMMFRYSFDMKKEADLLDDAVADVLANNYRTADIMQEGAILLSTKDMGDAVISVLNKSKQVA